MELINQIDETFKFNDKEIRVLGSYNEPLFVAKDICTILGLSNVTETLKNIPQKWKKIENLTSVSLKSDILYQEQGRNMIILYEPAVYQLIMRSNKPIAQKFKEAVCEEILPTLRKKGEYKIQSIIDRNKELEDELHSKENKIEELCIQNKSLSKYVVRKFNSRYNIGNCVYLITSSEIKGKFKVGSTKNINDRLSDLSTGSPYYFEILELFYTEFHVLLEQTIKEIFGKYRISVNCEWYELDSIIKMKEFIRNIIQTYNDFKINSNIHILDELENNPLSIKDNNKSCMECNRILSLNFFFSVDKKNKIFEDKCISCYEKDHGDSKQCSKCSKIKRKIDFVVDRSKKDGLTYECKDCRYEQNSKKKEEVKLLNPNLGKIQCETCSFFKDAKMFYKTKCDNGVIEYCKQCKECYCDEYGKSKQCFTCKEIKLESEFDKKSANTDGLECYCKTCRKQSRDDEKAKKKLNEDPNKDKKLCEKCKEYFNYKMFFKNINEEGTISYLNDCIKCYTPNSLQCNRCNIIKTLDCFVKDSSKKTGYHSLCKNCKKNK